MKGNHLVQTTECLKLFRQFTRFIKGVYKDVSTRLNELYRRETGKDLPILTDEIRSVMGRMLATDEQIVQAEQIYDFKSYVPNTGTKWYE